MKKYHNIIDVTSGLLVAIVIICVFNASHLHKWSEGLKVSKMHQSLEKITLKNWKQMHKLNLDFPQFALESVWMDFRDAHKLLYPKTFEQVLSKRQRKPIKVQNRNILAIKLEAKKLKRAFKSKVTPSVLLVGDSMMLSIAPTLTKKLRSLGGDIDTDARVSTGLARPDVYNWPVAIQRKTRTGRFDYIVLVIGTNDGQDFFLNGQSVAYGTKQWVKEYQKRIREISQITCEAVNKKVLWLGLPPMRNKNFNRKIARLNSWIRRQVAGSKCVEYVDLKGIYGDKDGSYTAYKTILDKVQKIRTSDGIHITRLGGNLISDKVSVEILENEMAQD